MNRFQLSAALAIAAIFAVSTANAQDTIQTTDGETINAPIKSVSPNAIVYERGGGLEDDVPVNKIKSIRYRGEPSPLRMARTNVSNGGYEAALKELAKLTPEPNQRKEITQDIQFYTALAKSRLALGGSGSIEDAGKLMYTFLREHPESYHFYEANEVLGDLLVATGKAEESRRYYGELAKAPWPDVQMRSSVAIGNVLLSLGRAEEAVAEFDKVIAAGKTASGDSAKTETHKAMLAKGAALAKLGQPAEGVKLIESVIAEADPEHSDLMADAYIALGNCYREIPDKKKEAMLAFLRVDVLFASDPQAHAEALANLSVLWNDLNQPQRALQAQRVLKERYGDSRWAK